jgi:hypothetical protein
LYLVNDVCGCHEICGTVLVLDVFWACAGDPECGTCEVKLSDLVLVPKERDALQKVGWKVSQMSLQSQSKSLQCSVANRTELGKFDPEIILSQTTCPVLVH